MDDRLYKSSTDRVLTGVAAGLAERMAVDPSLVRVVWVLLGIVSGGIFALIYLIMAVVVPERPAGAVPTAETWQSGATPQAGEWVAPDGQTVPSAVEGWQAPRTGEIPAKPARGPGVGALVGGVVLVAIGVWVLLARYLPGLALDDAWPWAVVVLGIVLVVLGFVAPGRR